MELRKTVGFREDWPGSCRIGHGNEPRQTHARRRDEKLEMNSLRTSNKVARTDRPQSNSTLRRLLPRLELTFLAGSVLALTAFLFAHFHKKVGPPVTLSTSMTMRLRNGATRIAKEAEKHGLAVQVTSGSSSADDILNQIETHQVDLALIPGGHSASNLQNVRQVAALDVDPLQLLVKQELFEEVSHSLTALKGKRINLRGHSGTAHALAEEVLR